MSNISRRVFLKKSSVAAASLTASSVNPLSTIRARRLNKKSIVAVVTDTSCMENLTVDQSKVNTMVNRAVMIITGISNDVSKAYEALFPKPVTATTKIAVKTNGFSGSGSNKTSKYVSAALKNGLTTMLNGSFSSENITITSKGSDNSNVSFKVGEQSFTLKKTWVDADYFINCPVCWAHSVNGATLGLKNTMSTVSGSLGKLHGVEANPTNPWCSIFNSQPTLKDKLVLVLMDCITGRSNGGPGGSPNFVEHKIIASQNLIAAEYHGIELLKKNNISSRNLKKAIKVMKLAADPKWDLGSDDPDDMEVIEWNPSPIKTTANHVKTEDRIFTRVYKSKVEFIVPETQRIKFYEISIRDGRGRKIFSHYSKFSQKILWDCTNFLGQSVSKGIYFYHIKLEHASYSGNIRI